MQEQPTYRQQKVVSVGTLQTQRDKALKLTTNVSSSIVSIY